MSPRLFLRLEGLCIFLAAAGLYAPLDFSWWLFVAALLIPDLFMAGYLAGARVGALLYNTGHTYVVPIGLGALGYALAAPLAIAFALIWAAHIGMDRALGYGLKRPSGFRNTHLTSSRTDLSIAPSREPTAVKSAL